jgi:hypothetical protein
LISELIAANLIHRQGREVRVVTKAFAAQLVGADPTSMDSDSPTLARHNASTSAGILSAGLPHNIPEFLRRTTLWEVNVTRNSGESL